MMLNRRAKGTAPSSVRTCAGTLSPRSGSIIPHGIDLRLSGLPAGWAEGSRLSGPVFERVHVAAQEVLHSLVKEELQIQSSGIRQRHHKTGQGSFGAAHHHVPKVGPIE